MSLGNRRSGCLARCSAKGSAIEDIDSPTLGVSLCSVGQLTTPHFSRIDLVAHPALSADSDHDGYVQESPGRALVSDLHWPVIEH